MIYPDIGTTQMSKQEDFKVSIKIGDLVCMKKDTDQKTLGIVVGFGSQWTDIIHPDSIVRVMWASWPLENECYLFKNALHVVSEA